MNIFNFHQDPTVSESNAVMTSTVEVLPAELVAAVLKHLDTDSLQANLVQ